MNDQASTDRLVDRDRSVAGDPRSSPTDREPLDRSWDRGSIDPLRFPTLINGGHAGITIGTARALHPVLGEAAGLVPRSHLLPAT